MEIQTTEKKPSGNPNFKKKYESKYNPQKRYQFQLCQIIETAKGRDWETGEMIDNPYPPVYIWMNDGQAIHPESGNIENWRYVFGFNSIWTKDQQNPAPTKSQLENPKNFIEFKNGSLFVSGTNSALIDSMMVQDAFEGVKNPINQVTPIYRLVDLEKNRKATRTNADIAFEAEKAAREATFEEMLPVAMHFGIDVDNPEQDMDRIRDEFIFRAKSDPEAFSKQFVNPKVKYKFVIVKALRKNLISTSIVPGKMVLTDTQKVYFDLKEGDAAEQFASLVLQRNDDAVKLYDQIQNLI